MKKCNQQSVLLFMLVAAVGSALVGLASAQSFTTLYNFTEPDTNGINSDGLNPTRLLVSGGTLYGVAMRGGNAGTGTIFTLSTNRTGFTTLYNFTALPLNSSFGNSDGALPVDLALSGNTLYGTTAWGGSSIGTLFALNTDGSGFSTLFDNYFNLSIGFNRGLALSGNTLYATTAYAGDYTAGMVFAINTDGSGFTVLHSFSGGTADGSDPGNLVLSGDSLYGMAYTQPGPFASVPTVFRLNTNGTGFTTLHRFRDNYSSYEGLVVSSNTIYVAPYDDTNIYSLNTDGTGFRTLHSITGTGGAGINLIISSNVLYGTTWGEGGTSGGGTVFKLNTDGTGFTTLYSFTGRQNTNSDGFHTNSDGYGPQALISDGNTLYGATEGGGSWGNGTIFSISLPVTPPQLTITSAGGNVILSWPTNSTGFTLQSTTSLASPALWTTNSAAPVIVNGQNTVTNPISAAQQFYRLAQ